jgi:hypothetical protein
VRILCIASAFFFLLVSAFFVKGEDETKKKNLQGVTNSVYGKLKITNHSQFEMVVDSADRLSSHGTFMINKPVYIAPGETSVVSYQLDWGVNMDLNADASARCEVELDAELGLSFYILRLAGKAMARFESEAACESAIELTSSIATGIVSNASVMAKFFFVKEGYNTIEKSLFRGVINVRPVSAQYVTIEQTGEFGVHAAIHGLTVCDGRSLGYSSKGSIDPYKVSPAWFTVKQPVSKVKSANLRCGS